MASTPRAGPREEGHDRARTSGLVTIIKVVGTGVVEIDGLLHQPHSKEAGIKIEVRLRVRGDCRHVMNAQDRRTHEVSMLGHRNRFTALRTVPEVRSQLLFA